MRRVIILQATLVKMTSVGNVVDRTWMSSAIPMRSEMIVLFMESSLAGLVMTWRLKDVLMALALSFIVLPSSVVLTQTCALRKSVTTNELLDVQPTDVGLAVGNPKRFVPFTQGKFLYPLQFWRLQYPLPSS